MGRNLQKVSPLPVLRTNLAFLYVTFLSLTYSFLSRINPIFIDSLNSTTTHKFPQLKQDSLSPDNPSSSGYGSHGGSSHDPLYGDNVRLREDAVAILEQNANFVKSILVAVKNRKKSRRSVGSLGSSGKGTLSTIPEGKIDSQIPRPVWPKNEIAISEKNLENTYDSIVDDALLLYTSLSYAPEQKEISAQDILKDLYETINAAVEEKVEISPEQILKTLNERLSVGLDLLNHNKEDDIRRLSVNLSNSDHLTAVVRAFSNSSSGNSSQSSPEWSRNRTNSMGNSDEIYLPSSSSGFSDSKNIYDNALPVFVHEDLNSVSNSVRNAMIYGTLCRNKNGSASEKLLRKQSKASPMKFSLLASPDEKPSVWEIYYGAGVADGESRLKSKTDASYFVSMSSKISQPQNCSNCKRKLLGAHT